MHPGLKEHSHIDVAAGDILTLSIALSRGEQLDNKDKIAIARRIGFAIGLDLAFKGPSKASATIESQISSLFGKLHLASPSLRDWDAVVFVKHTVSQAGVDKGSEVEHLKAAFGEGVLEGIVSGQEQGLPFLRHSMSLNHSDSKPDLESESK